VPAAAVDVHQLTDSMSSITIDPSTLSSGELTSTHHSQKKSSPAFHAPVDDQQRHRLPGYYDHRQRDLGGVDDATTGHVVFRHDDAVMSRTTPATHASASGVNFSQPITFQPGPTAAAYLQTPPESELNDNVDQFGCLGLQDMLIGDEFQ